MAPSKGRGDSMIAVRDLPQLPRRREMMASNKGRIMNRKSSSWTTVSWRTLLFGLILLVLAATTLIVSRVFDERLIPNVLVRKLPGAAIKEDINRVVWDTPNLALDRSGLRDVRDIVAFPDEVMLLVRTVPKAPMPKKDSLLCMFGGKERTGIYTIEWKDESKTLLAVRCEHPTKPLDSSSSKDATLVFADTDISLRTAAQYLTNSSWKPLVYETLTLRDSVLLFAKGLVDSQGRPNNHSKELHKLHCSFGGEFDHGGGVRSTAHVTTRVKVIAQEVVRCELPPPDVIQQLRGLPVSLFVPKIGTLRTVAYFDIPAALMKPLHRQEQEQEHQEDHKGDMKEKKRFFVCACTMLWNQADFLREWIIYHGFLGIEKWYLYDNNSDDDIEDVLHSLSDKYNVSRIAWPWIKTQEAGFSHCALRAKADCQWVLFADVDEFVYPSLDLHQILTRVSSSSRGGRPGPSKNSARHSAARESYTKVSFPLTNSSKVKPTLEMMSNYLKGHNTSILRNLIERTLRRAAHENRKVGEVRLVCHNFGPSHLTAAPDEGVTVGYTCRMKWPQRHKSFLRLDAMSDTLLNVVHHFNLAEGYKEIAVHARVAVINHYKFQAWEVFKAKFVRRVATYVVDWRQQTALSNDRAPGLGTEAIEPRDWPSRYCEEEDHGLRNFTLSYFKQAQSPNTMLWHLEGRKSQLQHQREREQKQQLLLDQRQQPQLQQLLPLQIQSLEVADWK